MKLKLLMFVESMEENEDWRKWVNEEYFILDTFQYYLNFYSLFVFLFIYINVKYTYIQILLEQVEKQNLKMLKCGKHWARTQDLDFKIISKI